MRTGADRPASRTRRARALRRRGTGAVLALAALAACTSGGEATRPATSSPPEPVAEPSSAPIALAEGQSRHHVGARFGYGAMIVTIGDAVYDEPAKKLYLGARFENLGNSWASTYGPSYVEYDSTYANGSADLADVPPHSTVDLTVEYPLVARDPFPDGRIVWGEADVTQPVIHLGDGRIENGWTPASLPIDAWASIGKYTIRLTRAELHSGFVDRNVQADPGQRVLRLTFDQWTARIDAVNGFYPSEHLRLVRPDGTTVDAGDSSDGFAPVSWTATTGNWIEFPVSSDPAGAYTLSLSSLSPKGFSSVHPELIETTSIRFRIGAVRPDPLPDAPVVHPRIPSAAATTPGETESQAAVAPPIDRDLSVASVNVPGFAFTPTHLRWDPDTESARVTGTVELIQRDDATAADTATAGGAAAGLLDVAASYSFRHQLTSGGRVFSGTVTGDLTVQPGPPRPVTIEFTAVDDLSPDDIVLYLGRPDAPASTIPLTSGSPTPRYPPPPEERRVDAPAVTVGGWSIQVRSWRVGMLQTNASPPAGQRDVEIIMDVTPRPEADQNAFGFTFRPSAQVFLSRPDGYLQQGVADSGLISPDRPGETHRAAVTFRVPDSFRPGLTGIVVRVPDELTSIGVSDMTETTFGVDFDGGPGSTGGDV